MSKFKFRVWDKKNIAFLKDLAGLSLLSDGTLGDNTSEIFVIQLFSTKKDKKNKQIFAGDIVKIHNKSENTKKEYWFPIFEVTFDGFEFGLKHLGGGKAGDNNMFKFRHYPQDLEVIGNIFESTIIIPKN
jgi:hypothetical protein